MADWLVEEGIGEHRAVRIEAGRIVQARVAWPGRLTAGSVVDATLIARTAGSSRGTARTPGGEEILLDRLPKGVSEGGGVRVAITRAAVDGPGRLKRAQGRPTGEAVRTLSLADSLRSPTRNVTVVRRFADCDWDELCAEALSGEITFKGGTLLLAPTPAMTTVDIDGALVPRALALAAVPALAAACRRLDIGGSVAVDFPTLSDKADRRAIDAALGEALRGWAHERTAMNGFGLVQLIARFERPSMLQLAAWRRSDFIWRNLLRRAELLDGAGMVELSIHPLLESAMREPHLADLERRTGKRVRITKAATLAPEAPHAQLVADE